MLIQNFHEFCGTLFQNVSNILVNFNVIKIYLWLNHTCCEYYMLWYLQICLRTTAVCVFKVLDAVCKAEVQSIRKKHIPPVFQHFVFPVYLRNRSSYKKSVFIFLHPFLKRFQLEQEFSHPVKKSADICKNVNFPIKS